MKSQLVWTALAVLSVVALGCSAGADDPGEAGGRLQVVATTTQIGDLAAQVGGDQISLTVLLRPNQDAHDFAPTPSQIRALERADIILRNGVGLDTFVTRAATGHAVVVVVTDGIVLRKAGGADGDREDTSAEGAGHDPHVWFAVENTRVMLRNVRDALVRADSANQTSYFENTSRYMAELVDLDRRITQQVATIPAVCRKLVTNHDTLGYYADAYGFEVVGSVISSVSSDARPSASDVAEIVRKIREQKVPAIFAETSLNPALVRQVGREAGVRVVDDLYGDSLGPEGSDAETYIEMMESNTRKIVDALKACPG